MINFVEYLNLPTKVALSVIALVFVMQIIGEILEFKGKVVPEFMKIRKYFHRKKTEKDEMASTLKEVQTLLNDVNSHYSSDNISKRNDWMNWVNARAEIYDESINQLTTAFTEVA